MNTQTLVVSKELLDQMKAHYAPYLTPPVPYSHFRAKKNGVTITGYTSGKVVFQGVNIDAEVALWQNQAATPTKKTTQSLSTLPKNFAQWTVIGSDEVGNGSYFGALTVAAVYVSPQQVELLQTLGVKDSKLLSDTQIKELAWQIKLCAPHHLTVCSPQKYNEAIINGGMNANSIKVSLHNFTIQKLVAKLVPTQKDALQGVLIDQFTTPNNYYKYLKQESNPYTESLFFAQKGESEHLAVACASIIARAAFLESLETFGKPYNVTLPSGAGANVDQFGKQLVAKHGADALLNTAKLHFANTKKILGK